MAIYVYTPVPTPTWYIPLSFTDLKSVMDGLGLTSNTDYTRKLHIPYTGYRSYSNGSIGYTGTQTVLWGTGNYLASNIYYGSCLRISDSQVSTTRENRASGCSVRLFSDVYIEPDNTRTVEAGTLGSAGIFHNADLGVISVTNGSDKNITMKDKNVGATVVYNNGDILSESNCGKFFQRGNYYGFPFTGNVTTSSSTVNTAGYGYSNPYSSSTFVKGSSSTYDRSNPQNADLWKGSKEEYFVLS